jgi:GNAT superfamily N-acetyltransferase
MEECVRVLAGVHAADRYPLLWPAEPARWLTPENLLAAWVAVTENGLAGHVALCAGSGEPAAPIWSEASDVPAENLGVIAKLFVVPSERGRDLGVALLDHAVAEARARALLPVLEVLDVNRAAIALYERLGWRRVGSAPATWTKTGREPLRLHYYICPIWVLG